MSVVALCDQAWSVVGDSVTCPGLITVAQYVPTEEVTASSLMSAIAFGYSIGIPLFGALWGLQIVYASMRKIK